MRTTASFCDRWIRKASRISISLLVLGFNVSGLAIFARPEPFPLAPRADAVVRLSAGGERIAEIRTARGVTTMISLPAEAKEAVCGDLFDAQSGNGCFVIQRSGRDLFLKPLKASGSTNLFVKTDSATYAFDLSVVPPGRAMRIVFVETAAPDRALAAERANLERDRAGLERDREQLAKDRAAAVIELDRSRAAIAEEANARAEGIARSWIADGAVDGAVLSRRSARGRSGIEVTLGSVAVRIGDRTALRCTVRNSGSKPVEIAQAEWSDTARRTTPVQTVAPAGGEIHVALWFPGPPLARGELRLLDASGAEIVAMRPFR